MENSPQFSVMMTQMVAVEELQVGMYVAQLDRPWLETPFLFQGFYIRDADEIELIKSYCKQVYVSRESIVCDPVSTLAPAGATSSTARETKKERKRFSLRSLFGFGAAKESNTDFHESTVFYAETSEFKDELGTASGIQENAIRTVHGVMQNLTKSGTLDLPHLETAVVPMVDSVLRNPAALACLVRLQQKNDYLYQHSLASSVWATILGRQIGLNRDDLKVIALGAMLLDVGKTQLPDEILSKPDKLNDEERELMRRHVAFGLDILRKAGDVDSRVLDMVAHHHERYNGTGYPAKLRGNDIPVFGRIAGIVDAYDAMITPRPYATLMSSYDALRKLRVLADVEFQAEIVEQFTRAIGAFPTGTAVELNSGEVAIVTKQNRIRRLRPEILIIMDANKELLENFRIVDLNEETVSPQGTHSLWIERGLPPGEFGVDPTEFFLN
ncbi:MAG: HD-GYP domain-containing protein [Woeseiaceae bacterium]